MRVLAIIAVGLLWVGTAAAEPTAVTPPTIAPSQDSAEERFAAALALMDQDELEKQMLATGVMMANTAFQSQIDAFRKQEFEFPPELVDTVRQAALDETKAMAEELAKTVRVDAAHIYARYFTAAELRELKELQARPVMRKAQAVGPQLSAELAKIGTDKAAERTPVLERRIEALIEEWLAKQQTVPGPSS